MNDLDKKAFLRKYEDEYRAEKERLGNRGLPEIDEALFDMYFQTGNRIEYEKVYFERRKFLSVFAMSALLYKRKEDIRRLGEIIAEICGEKCWALPAHIDRTQSDCDKTIDLFAAETAFSLADISFRLKDELSSDIRSLIRTEVFDRVLTPFRKRTHFGWEDSVSNWNAVCCGSVGSAAILLMEDDKPALGAVLERINNDLIHYREGFYEDGVCPEGLGYYTYGMMFLAAYDELLRAYTNDREGFFGTEKEKRMALFAQGCVMSSGTTAAFSDCDKPGYFRLGLFSYLSEKTDGITFPPLKLAAGLHSDSCYRYIVLSRDYFWIKDTASREKEGLPDETFFGSAEWWIVRSENDCSLAVKGGNNGESHNHNDVGSFHYVCGSEYILDDLGAGEYTADYFGNGRYDILNCRSAGHNLPVIDGAEQCAGAEFRADSFIRTGDGTICTDITSAYGRKPPDKIARHFSFDKKSGLVRITDRFVLPDGTDIAENLVSPYRPELRENGFMIKTATQSFNITVKGGCGFTVTKENYSDHAGKQCCVYFMRWKVSGGSPETELTVLPQAESRVHLTPGGRYISYPAAAGEL